jgi:hypothetical protein
MRRCAAFRLAETGPTKDATGGLLRRIRDTGVLVVKDVTSVISANHDLRATVLAAMREV